MTIRDPASGDTASADLLVIGASVRAAACSALRAGLQPTAIDQFGDADLRNIARVELSRQYPADLVPLAAAVRTCPWLYTGALENEPGVIATISRTRPLWGNGPDVLEQVRDPFTLAAAFSAGGSPCGLEIRPHDAPLPRDGEWVIRPRRSAAGRGIERWTSNCSTVPDSTHVFQRLAHGTSCSALFLGREKAADLVGITRQLHAPGNPFEWRGNIGPIELPESTVGHLLAAASNLVTTHGLRGLFGLDFVVDLQMTSPVPLVTEVNPRYTASVELLEFATGRPLLAEHARAFDERIPIPPRRPVDSRALVKFVAFSMRDVVVRGLSGNLDDPDPWRIPRLADRPCRGTPIAAGTPLCSLFGHGDSHQGAVASLEETARTTQVQTDAGEISLRDLVEWVNFDR